MENLLDDFLNDAIDRYISYSGLYLKPFADAAKTRLLTRFQIKSIRPDIQRNQKSEKMHIRLHV
jgi:hypothetical protein